MCAASSLYCILFVHKRFSCQLSVCSQVVVDGKQQIHYYTVSSSLAGSAVSSARRPSVTKRASYLKREKLRYYSRIKLNGSSHKWVAEVIFCDWLNAANHSGSMFSLNITLDNRSNRYYRRGNMLFFIFFKPHFLPIKQVV